MLVGLPEGGDGLVQEVGGGGVLLDIVSGSGLISVVVSICGERWNSSHLEIDWRVRSHPCWVRQRSRSVQT